jgi:hypothetical protein
MKKVVIIVFLLFFLALASTGEKIATLPELMKPSLVFSIDDTQLYIPEGAVVHIYSTTDYELKKKFGKAGEGPMEFNGTAQVPLLIDAKGKELIIFSLGKVSYFSKQGDFIKEKKAAGIAFGLQSFKDKFIGRSVTQENKVTYDTINLYDTDLKKMKELSRHERDFQGPGKGTKVLSMPFTFAVSENEILLVGKDDATIDVFDEQMKNLVSITVDQKRAKMDQDFKDKVTEFLKTGPRTKDFFEMMKPLKFPSSFPVIVDFFVDDDIIYVLTWTGGMGKFGCFSYTLAGKYKAKSILTIKMQNEFTPYPISFHKKRIYQLVENEDEEVWELHASAIQ